MTLLPIIARELRSSARENFTYYLRLLGAGALMASGVLFGLSNGFSSSTGGVLFGHFHLALFGSIWIFVPFLVADSISRERREGTLALLFLTRMRAADIVVAKGVVHGLRALTLWLAVLPVITVPILLGGVNGTEAILSGLVNFSALCLALAAGLVASSLSRTWTRVLVYAAALSLIFCILFVLAHHLVVTAFIQRLPVPFLRTYLRRFELFLGQGFWLAANWGGSWPMLLASMARPVRVLWIWGSVVTSLGSVLALLLAIEFAAWRVRRVWREEPPSARLQWVEDAFCRPRFFQTVFQRWMRRKLERNPIGWLELRSWNGRIVPWTWLGIVTCLYCLALENPFAGMEEVHDLVGWLLAGSIALNAAGSFRRERETGVLELLLVAPLSAGKIIFDRLRGLWTQFLPAIVLLVAVQLYLGGLFTYGMFTQQTQTGAIFFQACSFFTVPIVGLYFSLKCRSFMGAFLSTLAWSLIIPIIVAPFLRWLLLGYEFPYSAPNTSVSFSPNGTSFVFYQAFSAGGFVVRGSGWHFVYQLATLSAEFTSLFQLFLAGFLGMRLIRDLEGRRFSLERAQR